MIARSTKKHKSRTSIPEEDEPDVDYSKPFKRKGRKKKPTGMDKRKH